MSRPTLDLLERSDGAHLAAHVLEDLAFTEGRTPAPEAAAHLAACAECRAVIDRLRTERAAFLGARPADAFVAKLAADAHVVPLHRRARRWAAPLVALAAAAAAAAILVPRTSDDPATLAREGVTLRGGTSRPAVTLQVHVSRSGAPAVPLGPSDVLHAGDVLRFSAMLPEHGYVFVANVDASGRITRYFPAEAPHSAEVPRGLPRTLPGSIELDDFVGEERITLWSSSEPIEEAELFDALTREYRRAGGDLAKMKPLGLDAAESSVVVRKGPGAP